MTPTPPPPSPPPRNASPLRVLFAAVPALVLLGLGWAAYRGLDGTLTSLRQDVAKLTASNEELTRVMNLYRYERGSKGLGVHALLDQLRHWAPMLQNSSTPEASVPQIERTVGEIVDAMAVLGPDAFAPVEQALLRTKESEDELARWLLRAAERIDPARAEELLVRVLRRDHMVVTARLRMIAADQLTALDRERAGEELRRILEQESHLGVVGHRLPPGTPDVIPPGMAQATPEFWNFIHRYVATGDPQREATLIQILGRVEHDQLTVQETVKELGAMHSKAAAGKIQELFEKPVGATDNPLFRNHCLDALAQILGSDACGFFDAALTKEQNAIVANKLKDLIKRYCN